MKRIGLILVDMFTISSMLMLLVIAVIIITMPNSVLGLSKSIDKNNNNKDWNFYLANSHNLTALNATGTLKDCSATDMIGPCWNSPYGSVRP
jgi:hypothetical protein